MDLISYGLSKKYTDKIINESTPLDAMARLAAVDADGVDHADLKSRLDAENTSVKTSLAQKADQTDLETTINNVLLKADKTYVDTKFSSMGNTKTFKGSCTFATLPTSGMNVDDYWYVTDKTSNYCWNGTSWVDIGNALKINDGTITPQMLNTAYSYGQIRSNLIDNTQIAVGKYVNTANGNLLTLSSMDTTGYLPVVAGGVYSFSKAIGASTYGLYDSNKVFLSGGSSTANISVAYTDRYVLTVPNVAGVAFIKITGNTGKLATGMFVQGSTLPSSYQAYEYVPTNFKDLSIQKQHLSQSVQDILNAQGVVTVTKTVKQDGTGDYTSLRTALESITDASANKIYNVEVYEGTYNVLSYYTDTEIADANFSGLFVPDYTYLIGVGKRENIIINGELATANTMVSTLNLKNTSGLENLTVTSNNLRYTIHDDFADIVNNGYERRVKNCTFKKTNSAGTFYPAYGAGCRSGAEFYFENCIFVVDYANPFSMHNNTNFTKPAEFYFENCQFRHPSGDSIVFGSMGSKTKDQVYIKGCIFARIYLHEEQNNGCGNDFTVNGYGNSEYLYNISVNDGKPYFVAFSDDSLLLNASTAITKGMAVKRNGVRMIDPMSSASDIFYGIALEDIALNGVGTIRTSGYIKGSDVGIATLNVGDKVGVSGSSLVVTTGAYIGICDIANYFRITAK